MTPHLPGIYFQELPQSLPPYLQTLFWYAGLLPLWSLFHIWGKAHIPSYDLFRYIRDHSHGLPWSSAYHHPAYSQGTLPAVHQIASMLLHILQYHAGVHRSYPHLLSSHSKVRRTLFSVSQSSFPYSFHFPDSDRSLSLPALQRYHRSFRLRSHFSLLLSGHPARSVSAVPVKSRAVWSSFHNPARFR